jgi:hypothetical protein
MERSCEEVRVIINWGFVSYSWLLAGPKVPVCSLDLLVTNPELFEPWKDHGGSTSPFIPGGACSGFPAEQERSPQGRKPLKLWFLFIGTLGRGLYCPWDFPNSKDTHRES